MGYQEDVGRLEQIVEKMLQQIETLRRRNSELSAALLQKEGETARLQDELSGRNQERGEVQDRLSKLIDSIEEWESSAPEEESAEADPSGQLALNLSGE